MIQQNEDCFVKWIFSLFLLWGTNCWSGQQCINSVRSIIHGVARDENGKIMHYIPLTKNNIILDSQLVIVRGKKNDSSPIPESFQPYAKFLRDIEKKAHKHGDNLHYWLPDHVITETGVNGNQLEHPRSFPAGSRRLAIHTSRDSSEYKSIVAKLEEIKVGQRKKQDGVDDRKIVADLFFAETTKGAIPRFATGDRGIIEPLCRLSPSCAKALNNRTLHADFPEGFEVNILDSKNTTRTIKILPIPGKKGI